MRSSPAGILKAALFICLGAFLLGGRAHASGVEDEVGGGTFGLGLNYPGVGMRYFMNDRFALEAKAQKEQNVLVGGFRLYNYFRPAHGLFLILGVEGDYVHYKSDVSMGSGYAGGAFAGVELFVLPRVTLQADFGPTYVSLRDQNELISVGSIEYVVNFGINAYWGGSSP